MVTSNLLSSKQVADILGVSKAMAYKLMRTILPVVRIGRTVRVRPEDLDLFIAQNSERNRTVNSL